MNDRYFVCKQDKCFVDAGYRWAFWMLEEKSIVVLGKEVDVDSLLIQKAYWYPPEEEKDDWLCNDILPTVKAFLKVHKKHCILYVDEEYIYNNEDFVEWTMD